MVNLNVAIITTSVKYTTTVEAPSGCITRNGKRSFGGNVLHEYVKVVVWKGFVTTVVSRS